MKFSRNHLVLTIVLLHAGACSESERPKQKPEERACAEASEALGELACVHRVPDEKRWNEVGIELHRVDQVRAAKYMVPARDGARLPPLVINAHRFELHYDFMVEAFPELFPGLTPIAYLELLFDEKKREFLVGDLVEFRSEEGTSTFGFTIATNPDGEDGIGCKDVQKVYDELTERVYAKGLAVVPSDNKQLAWLPDCDLPVRDPNTVEYEAYNRAVGFGTLRRYTGSELEKATEDAEYGFQDILVLDEAPIDLERVISGAVTGTRQGPLSHLAVRSASRGTPNCYVRGAYDLLAPYQDKLVRIECAADTLLVREATREEAEAFWDKLKPAPVAVPEPDYEQEALVELSVLDVASKEARARAVRRFGAKGMNLAWLRQNLDPELTPPGFLVPVKYYRDFIENNTWEVDLGTGKDAHTFKETLDTWLDDPAFQADAKLRRERLTALQAAFLTGACDPALLDAIAANVEALFGDDLRMVRLRSSSNAEDGAFFNGAGLYDSYSGCVADERDGDTAGPSLCDASKKNERGICEALTKVWASLWNVKAVEERAFYGIDQHKVAMAVLVNDRSEAERANMVAFTGNPVQKNDSRYLINAQIDEIPVVSPDPGVWPEQDLLRMKDGEVVEIVRAGHSSELPEGEYVLSDGQLKELGRYLALMAERYPFDIEPPKGRTFLLDSEWKVMPDGALRVKQVRPFLK